MRRVTLLDLAAQSVSLVMGGHRVTLTFRAHAGLDRFMADVALDDRPVLQGVRLVEGVDIMGPFAPGLGSIIVSAGGREPTRAAWAAGDARLLVLSEAERERVVRGEAL